MSKNLGGVRERLDDLERRVKALEAVKSEGGRGRGVAQVTKLDAAQKWIIEYLKGRRKRISSKTLQELPVHSELVNVIMREARKNGFSPQMIRNARIELNAKEEVVMLSKVPNSRDWIWRLT